MMNGKELVDRAVRFTGPERIPYDLLPPYASDFVWVKPSDLRLGHLIKSDNLRGGSCTEDEWGCIWAHASHETSKGYVVRCPITDYALLKTYSFPDMADPERYVQAKKAITENKEEKFVVANTRIGIISRLQLLRGFENMLTDPFLYPDDMHMLLDKLVGMQIQMVGRLAGLGVHGVFWCDDWGMQDRSLFSAVVFKSHFKPYYRAVYAYAHKLGLITMMHSCGNILELLEDFIDAGLDVIQLDQVESMGTTILAKRFAGKICFWCPVDLQRTMIRGTPHEVKTATRLMMKLFGEGRGGFIGKAFYLPEAITIKEENIAAMAETLISEGNYPLAIQRYGRAS